MKLLLKQEQFQELKEVLNKANPETKFIFCLLANKTIEENFDVIISLIKENNYKELFKKIGSKASKEASSKAIGICGQEDFPWLEFISTCKDVAKFMHDDYTKDFIVSLYNRVSYKDFLNLIATDAIAIYGFISDILPSDKIMDFLSFEYEGERVISYIHIRQWIDKVPKTQKSDFINLCIEQEKADSLAKYCINCSNREDSVSAKRVKSIFDLVREDLKIKLFLSLYEHDYNSSYNVFKYQISHCSSSYNRERGYLDIIHFIDNIPKTRWYNLITERVSVIASEPEMLFERLNDDDMLHIVDNIPLDDLRNLDNLPEFAVKKEITQISEAINARMEGKNNYDLSSLID